ncbi:uncharacterized protein [Ptychodera flava]|uniref:uncharacterized protein n=1 Tax=Ptychodera flava TaxID=63121 RepID=UPI00396A6E24
MVTGYLESIVFATVLLLCNTVPVKGQCSSSTLELAATSSEKVITSPNFPNPYSADSMCSWKLSAASSDHRISLTVTDSTLEDPYSGDCAYDYVVVRDGATSSSDVLVQWCGTDNPRSITSSGSDLFVEFVSDSATQQTGFSLKYQSFELGSCPLNWYGNSTHCYRMRTDVTDWDTAQTHCMNDASNLASVLDDEEAEYLQSTFASPWSYTWIGLERYSADSTVELKWIDRSVYEYHNWTSGYPEAWDGDEKCAVFDISDGSWLVQSCYNDFAFVCKRNIDGTTQRYAPGGQPIEEGGKMAFSLWGIILICAIGVLAIIGVQAAVRWKISQRNQTAPESMKDEEEGTASTARHKTSSRATNGSTPSRESPRKLGWETNSQHSSQYEHGGTRGLPPLLNELDKMEKTRRKKRRKKLPPVRQASKKRSPKEHRGAITPTPVGVAAMETPPGTVEESARVFVRTSPQRKRSSKTSSLVGVERSHSFDM